jgi:transcriptional regulator with XRE-family HTH domain
MKKRDRKQEAIDLCIKVGKNIRRLRENKELTVAEVAYRSGVEPQNFRKYELGKQEMRISMLIRVAEALEVTPEDLLN